MLRFGWYCLGNYACGVGFDLVMVVFCLFGWVGACSGLLYRFNSVVNLALNIRSCVRFDWMFVFLVVNCLGIWCVFWCEFIGLVVWIK